MIHSAGAYPSTVGKFADTHSHTDVGSVTFELCSDDVHHFGAIQGYDHVQDVVVEMIMRIIMVIFRDTRTV